MGLRGHRAAAQASGHTLRFLVVTVGPTAVALPAHWVRGIITPAEAGQEKSVTWADSSYERTDLAARLAIGSRPASSETRIILYGNEQCVRSFMVDQVTGLVDLDRSQVQPLPPQFRGGERERLLGLIVDAAYVALIMNPLWLLELPFQKNVLDMFAPQESDRRAGILAPGAQPHSAGFKLAAPASVVGLK